MTKLPKEVDSKANGFDSYWQCNTLEPAIFNVDSPPQHVTVAIIGGGMMGVSTAYWLARNGVDVLVIEKQRLACRASGRNGGIVTVGPIDEYIDAVQKFGQQVAQEITQATVVNHQQLKEVMSLESIEAGYQTSGFLSIAYSKAELRTLEISASLMQADGFIVKMIDRNECEDHIGTALDQRFLGGALSPDDGMLQPLAYVYGLAQAAMRYNAKFLVDSPVISFHRKGMSWLVFTPRGAIIAEHLVLATNEETPKILQHLGRVIKSIPGQIIVTEPTSICMRVSWAANEASEYGRQTDEGGLLIGGFGHRPQIQKVFAKHPLNPSKIQAQITAYLRETFPEQCELKVVSYWTGDMAVTKDHLPIVGSWPGEPRLWLIIGFGGQGLPFSQVIPQSLALAIISDSPDLLPHYYSLKRFEGF
jgi:glycine/D-amino acid oxidase-like deaminating enzyme